MTSGFVLFAAVDPEALTLLGEVEDAERIGAGHVVWWSALVDEDLFWAREEILRRIVEATGRPALLGLTLDSDFLGVVGRTVEGSLWDGVVDREAAEDYREEGLAEEYDVVVPEFAAPEVAVREAIAWAEAAGLSADRSALEAMFSEHEWEKPADQYWMDLLSAVGLGG
ncbi:MULTISPECIES: hypothetical protein [unclassified Nocardioides]|uniref:hypothetical protein n=1 Tax=unclassified Nocardioides TaxID=2615069 RepID=UPI0007038A2D|nr:MULTISPECIES: hypothetical protein [unclassified Nocardioides]KRC53025.1 hypothetical protein ASE19_11575 [Nocardioides sp. Root79]KRC72554.1 hypothetical protein ASE20_08105 [Nocardioides sp. Root240]